MTTIFDVDNPYGYDPNPLKQVKKCSGCQTEFELDSAETWRPYSCRACATAAGAWNVFMGRT